MLLSLEGLISSFGLRPSGVLHLGAHLAEEAPEYARNGLDRVVWVEGNPGLIHALTEQLRPYAHQVIEALVDEEPRKNVELNVTNNTQASSILTLGTHRDHHPEVSVGHVVTLKTTTVDELADAHDLQGLDLLNIDLQGAELRALRGATRTLAQINYVYTEVNREELYEGGALVGELDRFLGERQFRRAMTRWTEAEWGDALYIRRGAPSHPLAWGRARFLAAEATGKFLRTTGLRRGA